MSNLNREVWEGWTPQHFIDALDLELHMIMTGMSWVKPFKTKAELARYIVDHQPYYKKPVPEVIDYFSELYGLE